MSDEIQKKQIIDYTSTTTLANGDKLLLQKADGTTMNVDYTELARNIITQYNAQTLAGSAQSIQSAFAALNSKTTFSPSNAVGSSSKATFSLNQGRTNGQICIVSFNLTTTEEISSYSEFILLDSAYIPSGTDYNVFASTLVGTETKNIQWQVMRTGYIRPGTTIPSDTLLHFTLTYIRR